MQLITVNNSFHYETENLLRVFFPQEKIISAGEIPQQEDWCLVEIKENRIRVSLKIQGEEYTQSNELSVEDKCFSEEDSSFFERKIAQLLFGMLCHITGYTPCWGILTGVRPAKLMGRIASQHGEKAAVDYFRNELLVSDEKTQLALTVSRQEEPIVRAASAPDSFSLYVSVPFCPTRCSYCSFISHSNESAKKLIPEYVKLLCRELRDTAVIVRQLKLRLESVYIGGGTPTVLSAEQLREITDIIKSEFDLSSCREYTIEAGRPDSITKEKLQAIKESGCTRISINPQSFDDGVLREIGRNHTAGQTLEAMDMARQQGFGNINMDLIAGLPGDNLEIFSRTIDTVLSLEPENITVHTLALKRSSTLVTEKRDKGLICLTKDMLSLVQNRLTEKGYIPYYMYRQSKTLGNLENVGWAKEGYQGLYNVYMMEECHTILSVGAGAVIKLKAPAGNEIERIYNYKYPYEYIGNFQEILNRKKYIYEFYSKYGC